MTETAARIEPAESRDAMPVSPHVRATDRGSPLRAFALAILFAPICCYWAQEQCGDRFFSLMVPPVVLTLLLVSVNVLLRRFAPRVALREGELVLFFAMQAVVCAMASEWMDVIQPYIYSYAVFTDRDTRYKDKMLPYLSGWLFFKSDAGLKDFAGGGERFPYFLSHLGIWWPKIW